MTCCFFSSSHSEFQAIIADLNILRHHQCKEASEIYRIVGKPIKLIGRSLAVQKGSLLKTLLTNHLRIFKRNGYLHRLEEKWLKPECFIKDDGELQSSTYTSFGGAFAMLYFGLPLSLIVFGIELFIQRR